MNQLNKYWYSGLREIVLKRDNYRCINCGMTREDHRSKYKRDITLNHINGVGTYYKNKAYLNADNRVNNLETLCLPCHGKKDIKRRTPYKDISIESRKKMLRNLTHGHSEGVNL